MSQLRIIVGAGALGGLRWAREHLYVLLVLTPLMLGMTYFGVGRLLSDAEWSLGPAQASALAVLAAAGLVVSGMSRAAAEVYHTRRPESVFDTLAVGPDVLLAAALARRGARGAGFAAAALVGRGLAGGGPFGAEAAAALLLFVPVVTLGEVFAALNWVHGGRSRGRGWAALGVAGVFGAALVGGALLLTIVRPQALAPGARAAALWGGALLTGALAWLAFALHRRWRAGDIEHAKRLRARDRWGRAAAAVARRAGGGAVVESLLARDLRLTLRGFSSAVYACAGLSALWVLTLVAVLETVRLPGAPPGVAAGSWAGATWLPSVLVVKGACVLACVSLACLVPALVAHQLPHLWLERAAGAHAAEVARAKLFYARVLTLPAALLAWAAGSLAGASPLSYVAPLLGECLWLWWLVGTLAGGLAYEMPEQPGLSTVLVACVCLAAGGFTAFLWPMGLALYAFGLPQLLLRGQHRAHLHLSGREV
ncbi:MAG TPA: hypothetical protein VEY09_13075 [Pyrinomonadaceae bacterium]|nr:hypothetical protein [Pyrinomonadaceae bacterium]